MPKQSHFKASCHSDMCFRVSPGHKELCWQRYLTLTASPNPHWCIYLLPGREWNGRRATLRMPPAWTLPLSCCFTHHSWTFWGILEVLGIHKEAESMKARSILLTKDAYSISVTLSFGREGEQLLGSLESHLCGGHLPLVEILENWSPGKLPWASQGPLSSLLYQAWCPRASDWPEGWEHRRCWSCSFLEGFWGVERGAFFSAGLLSTLCRGLSSQWPIWNACPLTLGLWVTAKPHAQTPQPSFKELSFLGPHLCTVSWLRWPSDELGTVSTAEALGVTTHRPGLQNKPLGMLLPILRTVGTFRCPWRGRQEQAFWSLPGRLHSGRLETTENKAWWYLILCNLCWFWPQSWEQRINLFASCRQELSRVSWGPEAEVIWGSI